MAQDFRYVYISGLSNSDTWAKYNISSSRLVDPVRTAPDAASAERWRFNIEEVTGLDFDYDLDAASKRKTVSVLLQSQEWTNFHSRELDITDKCISRTKRNL